FQAHVNVSLLSMQFGDFAAAEKGLREAMRLAPRCSQAHAALAFLLGGRLPATDQAAMRQLLLDPRVAGDDRRRLHFGLTHVCDARGKYALAAPRAQAPNAVNRAPHHQT